jgi:hypothetical protein
MKTSLLFAYSMLAYINNAVAQEWKAQWISTMHCQSSTNTWMGFRKEVNIDNIPAKVIAKIAADSKYWLWVNGKPVVFEGELKRGPTPSDTYYDEVDIAPYLEKGKNSIAVLVWYFGKNGFSHNSSGKAGLLFDCRQENISILSDKTWECAILDAYQTAGEPMPNFRLPESSILYDARREIGPWHGRIYEGKMDGSLELGKAGASPWNKLVVRPIPQWKDFGLKDYSYCPVRFPYTSNGDTIVCTLPYDAQVTPYMKIKAAGGRKITVCTDNYLFYKGGPGDNLRAEYISRDSIQEYECPGWMNGHHVYYIIPRGIKVLALKFRETGYNTDFAGSFHSTDTFLNKLWTKAQRTLYVTMRDTYMDCPERERAQWAGDAVIESGEAFYALSPSSHALSAKWLRELIGWQRKDSVLFAPAPAGNWNLELPGQSLAAIGYFGLWNYYLHTGDKKILSDLYAGIQRYMDLWRPDEKGTMLLRPGDWTWGDWGDHRDMLLLYNLWYYLAVKGMRQVALELNKTHDATAYATFMESFKASFNRQFWTGVAYRSPAYTGKTDDRAQALAVVAGVAGPDKYAAIAKVFQKEEHASPYMEKYVLEALFIMGRPDEALIRIKRRFGPMVNYPRFTTLFEGWGIGENGFGGGSVNHAWSGGGLTVLSQYLCGISPVKPGYRLFQVLPRPGPVKSASATVASVAGNIMSSFTNDAQNFTLIVDAPISTTAIAGIPAKGYTRITLNDKVIWRNGKFLANKWVSPFIDDQTAFIKFKVPPGTWKFSAR